MRRVAALSIVPPGRGVMTLTRFEATREHGLRPSVAQR